MPTNAHPAKTHDGQLDLDEAPIRRLVAGQFPRWGRPAAAPDRVLGHGHGQRYALFNLRLCRVALGDELVIRQPMMPVWAGDVDARPRARPEKGVFALPYYVNTNPGFAAVRATSSSRCSPT